MENELKPMNELKTDEIKRLKTEFVKNGYNYHLEKRTDGVAMYRVSSRITGKILSYEVFRVVIKPAKGYRKTRYEHFPSNEDVGTAYDAKAFFFSTAKKRAEEHYMNLILKCDES